MKRDARSIRSSMDMDESLPLSLQLVHDHGDTWRITCHHNTQGSAVGDVLPPGFVRAVLDDAKYTDLLMDALEARITDLEEVAAARGVRRVTIAWRLARSLRASVRHFPGRSFRERRLEAASTDWGST